jgi:hypothetical protein
MITPDQLNNIDETIDDVNLKKLEDMTEDEKLEHARKLLKAAREFHEGGPRRLLDLDLEDGECGVNVGEANS